MPKLSTTADFTLAGYRGLLISLLGKGYEVRGFADADPQCRHLVLRHDIDVSIEAALPVAAVEKELALRATYFVLLRGEIYNPFSKAGLDGLMEIAGMGHEIGLHLDAALYGDDRRALDRAAEAECAALEALVGREVRVISFHRPAKSLLGFAGPIAGRRHAYEPRFFAEMGYCSDSKGDWHHGAPLEHPAVAKGRALQLLTHPVWWTGEGAPPEARLRRFLEARMATLDDALATQCSVHRPRAGETAAGAEDSGKEPK